MAPPRPPLPELRADPRWRGIDLLSDVHLQAGLPRTFEAWRQHLLHTTADAVLMLGDLFEVWVGDDQRHGGFEAQCLQVLKTAAEQRVLAFLPGNRDFLVGDAMLADAGLQRLADPTLLLAFGQRWLLSHGDALCLSDQAYQQFRQQVRAPAWQQAFLAQPLALRQQQARLMREASTAHQASQPAADRADLADRPDWADIDNAAALAWLDAAAAPALIHGHTHRPASHALPGGRSRHVLGDWDLDATPPRARALRLTASGLAVLDLAQP